MLGMAKPPKTKISSTSLTLERKINAVKRFVFWTTAINIVIVVLVIFAAFFILTPK